MQESIDRAVNWTNNNCMKINSNKSKEMVICFTPDENVRNSIPSIVIDGNIVDTVEYAKLLGEEEEEEEEETLFVNGMVTAGAV